MKSFTIPEICIFVFENLLHSKSFWENKFIFTSVFALLREINACVDQKIHESEREGERERIYSKPFGYKIVHHIYHLFCILIYNKLPISCLNTVWFVRARCALKQAQLFLTILLALFIAACLSWEGISYTGFISNV